MQQIQLSVSPEQLTELAQAWLDAERYSSNVAGVILGVFMLISILFAIKYRNHTDRDGWVISLGCFAFLVVLSTMVVLCSLPLYRENALGYAKMKVMTGER